MTRQAVICNVLVGLVWSLALAQSSHPDAIQDRIDRARELNVTAPWPESEAILEELVPVLDRATPSQRTQVHLLRARNRALAGEYQAGLDIIETVLAGEPSPQQRLRALELGANTAVNKGDFETTFTYLGRAMELAPDVDAPDQISGIYSLASYFHTLVGEVDKALNYGLWSVEVAREAGLVRTECTALQRFALALETAGQAAEAETTYRSALAKCQAAADPVYIAAVEIGLGEFLRSQTRLGEAEEWLSQGIERMAESGFTDGLLNGQLYRTRLWFEQSRSQEARELLEQLVDQLEERGLWERLADAHDLLAQIARKRGDDVRALEHYQAHMEAREKFLNRERAMRLAYLEVEFDIQRHEQEIALLRERNRVLELEEEARTQQNVIYIGGAAGLGVIGILLALLLFMSQVDRRRYRRLSERDGLTGLYNHTQFFNRSKKVLEDARKRGSAFALIMADIDHFKQINDTYGHIFGDQVLERTASRMRGVFGEYGIVGRIGGEEFGIALPGCTTEEAMELIDRFRESLGAMRKGDKSVKVTLSYGIAQLANERRIESLRHRADGALYSAKQQGRDCMVLDDELPEQPVFPELT